MRSDRTSKITTVEKGRVKLTEKTSTILGCSSAGRMLREKNYRPRKEERDGRLVK